MLKVAHSSRHNVLGSMDVFVHVCVCVCACVLVCLCVHVCVVACMCMCGDQVVPGHSPVGSGGQTPCPYLLKVLLNHDISALYLL